MDNQQPYINPAYFNGPTGQPAESLSGVQPETSNLPQFLCARCGESSGHWQRGQQVQLGRAMCLEPNQRVALWLGNSRHYVYTHVCADSVGIDLPGVGCVDAPEVSPVEMRSGREDAGGGIGERSPDPAIGEDAADKRERLLARLLVSARDLAMAQLDASCAFCFECGANEVDGAIAHDGNCRAARVLRVMADLIATLPEFEKKIVEQALESPDRKIARELLTALYTMIGRFGMPTDNTEMATELRLALEHAEAAGIDEVLA